MKIKQLYTSFGIFLDIFKSAWFWSTSSFHHYSRAVVVGNFNLQPSLSFCKVSSIVRWYMTKIISYSSSFKYFWSKGAGLSQHNEVVIVVCCGAGAIIITGIIQYVVPFSRLVSTSWKLEPIVWEATYIRAIITKVKFRKKSYQDQWQLGNELHIVEAIILIQGGWLSQWNLSESLQRTTQCRMISCC